MIEANNIIAFLATSNAQSCRAFFEGKLGLELSYEDDFAIVYDANEIELRIQKLAHVKPQQQTVLGWGVDSIKTAVLGLSEKGVEFIRYDGLTQDELCIWTSPSGAKIAWFKDPDGNVLSITEHNLD